MNLIILLIVSLTLTYLSYPVLEKLLITQGLVSKNYLGEEIPTAYGSLLVLNYLIILGLGSYFAIYPRQLVISYLFFVPVVGVVGLADDYLDQGEYKGLSGHFKESIFGEQLTTGFLKALSITLFSLLLVLRWTEGIFWWGINLLLIILMTNFINLLDLRPGRAWKGFIFLFLFLAPLTEIIFLELLTPLLAMAIVLLPIDLQGRAMLGDVGANFLGAMLGLAFFWALAPLYKLLLVLGLIFIHFYTERISLTKLIAENRFLAYLDQLGR